MATRYPNRSRGGHASIKAKSKKDLLAFTSKGGTVSAKKLSKKQRSARARKAAKARWAAD